MTVTPATCYAKSGDVHIAYQVSGSGPIDLVLVQGFVTHLELELEDPRPARFFSRLASFSRLIRFDKRGTGLSDRVGALPTLEERMDDVRAVLDAIGSTKATLFGISEGGPMSVLFAATYPERASALVLYGAMAKSAWAPDNPWGRTQAQLDAGIKSIQETWGEGRMTQLYAPSLAANEEYRRWRGRVDRAGASPGAVTTLLRMNAEIDVRAILPSIDVPTLVMHRTDDKAISVEHGRYIARHIPNARYLELPGEDHAAWVGDTNRLCDEAQTFLTGASTAPEHERVLATVLFTDIIGATERAAALGDQLWKELLAQHHFVVRQHLQRHRGREVDTAGDGFLATFDGPARAVRCGRAIADAVRTLGIEVRAGVHTGECEPMDGKLGGIAVHIGARIMAQAKPNEVLVSSTVRDLVAGSGLAFEPRGTFSLKGVPGEWTLLALVQAS